MTTTQEVTAMLQATLHLARAGELQPLAAEREWLARSLIVTLQGVLAWHAAREGSDMIWCGACQRLAGRRHKCKGGKSGEC